MDTNTGNPQKGVCYNTRAHQSVEIHERVATYPAQSGMVVSKHTHLRLKPPHRVPQNFSIFGIKLHCCTVIYFLTDLKNISSSERYDISKLGNICFGDHS